MDRTTLFSPEGVPFRTSSALTITRLKTRGYTTEPPKNPELFHPGDHTVPEVQAYLDENPDDAARVIAEEKATAKPRVSIVGD